MLAAMSAAPDLSFDALAPPGETCSCLAYWIGPSDVQALRGVDAIGLTRAMSLQYDVEDLAERTGTVIADAPWRADFTAVAPVQLTRAWSPLPYAVDALGPPDWVSIEPAGMHARAAACAWRPSADTGALAAARGLLPDQDRFRRLLIVALIRAREINRGVVIVAKPGWSYEHARPTSHTTRRLMESAGFVVQDRHA
jgi:hypothetical protein